MLITRQLIVDGGWQLSKRFSSSKTARIPSPRTDKQVQSYQQVFPGRVLGEFRAAASTCGVATLVVSGNGCLMTTATGLKKVAFD